MGKRASRIIARCCGYRPMRLRVLVFIMLAGGVLLLLFPASRLLGRSFRTLNVWEQPPLCHFKQISINWSDFARQTEDGMSRVKCVHPVLNPYDSAVMQFYEKVPPIDCSSAMEDWVYVTNGTFHISQRAIEKYGKISCDYTPVLRDGDFKVRNGPHVNPMLDGMPIPSDFFKVVCESLSGKSYTNVHASVARNSAVMKRLHNYHFPSRSEIPKNTKPDQKSSPDTPPPAHTMEEAVSLHRLNLSILVLGFDSLSRLSWIRLLPKTREYLLDSLAGVELESYNILGDGTPAALLPILTGKLEEELPDARRGYSGAKPVDGHPWVWKEFSKHGYVTAYAEDAPGIGTVQYRMLGFQDQPTDHYLRTFFLAAEKTYNKNPRLCLGSKPRHVNFFTWFGSLLDMYRDFPRFFFGFYSEMSHDSNNKVQSMDDDLVSFLQELNKKGHLNTTLLILMADHGARYDYIRATAQGKLEERMPYFSIRFPPWFRRQYPNIIRNIHINSKRLTTPFDIHATFHDILNYSNTNYGNLQHRSISLFKEIPEERTCSHAEVTPHWCACIAWQQVNQSDPLVMQAVNTAIQAINSYTQNQRNKCAQLSLLEVTKSFRYVPNSADRIAEWIVLKFNNAPPPDAVELYQVSFKTTPGQGHFEVTCRYDIKSKSFHVEAREISRINKYGSQPACVQASLPHLRPYCYCV